MPRARYTSAVTAAWCRIRDHNAGAEPPAAGHHTLGGTDQPNAATTCGGGKLRVHRILAGAVLPPGISPMRASTPTSRSACAYMEPNSS